MLRSRNVTLKIFSAKLNYLYVPNDSLRSRLLRNSIVVGLGISIARFFSVLLQILVAAQFGISKPMDAYALALSFVIFLQCLLADSLRTAVIPLYIHTRQNKGSEAGQLMQDNLLGITLLGGIFFTVVILSISPGILKLIPHYDIEAQTLTYKYIVYLSPLLLLQAFSAIGGGLLQSENKFKVPSLATAAGTFITLSFFFLCVSTMKMHALILGVLLGATAEVAIIGYATYLRGCKFQFNIKSNPGLLRKIFDAYWPIASGTCIGSLMPLIGQFMSAPLGVGSVASLGYSQRISQLVLGIMAVIIGQTVMPEFSKIAAADDFRTFNFVLKKIILLLMKITIPVVIMLILFSHHLTRMIFERGEFTSESTSIVSSVQIYYFLQIPFYIMGIIYTQALIALRARRVFFWAPFYYLSATIGGNILFTRYFGLPGISLNAALLSCTAVIFYNFYVRHIVRSKVCETEFVSRF